MDTSPTQPGAVKPEWIRFPRNGARDPLTGLNRRFLFDLAQQGLIKTVSLRKRGARRGVRLIAYDSLMDYINRCAKEAN